MTTEERFWAKVDRRGPDECWPWLGSRNAYDYGTFRLGGGVVTTASRACLILGGRDPGPRMHALHSCDNPICVNPAHLSPGSPARNFREARDRGLIQTKLTIEQARAIRARIGADSYSTLAAEFGVSKSLIGWIAKGSAWRELAEAA